MRRILVLLAVLLVLTALPVRPCVAEAVTFTGVVTAKGLKAKELYLQNGSKGYIVHLNSSERMSEVSPGNVVTVSGYFGKFDSR